LAKISSWKPSLRLTTPLKDEYAVRPAIGESLGVHFEGACLPGPCHSDPTTAIAGVLKRFGTLTPDPDPVLFKELLEFADWFVPTQFKPIASDADVSVEAWLLKCKNYTQKRKAELLDAYYAITDRKAFRVTKVKSFIKDERYAEYKHARGINSRADPFKTLCGPYFRLIEEVFFKHPDFIKKVPVAVRPQYLFDKLCSLGMPVQCMDFKAMESHFTKLTFELEFRFYDYMTSCLLGGREFREEVRRVLAGLNVCHYKDFIVLLEAARMSGEMNTSLGNGFVNWITSKFWAFKNGKLNEHRGVFEGDDSAVVSDYIPTVADYRSIGFQVEMNVQPTLETASFCGLIFDVDDRVNVTDPLQELITFGWTNMRYVGAKKGTKLALLRCKALSMVYQYAGCPILAALGRFGMRVTKHVCIRKVKDTLSLWEKEQLDDALDHLSVKLTDVLNVKVGMKTRLLMERVYGVRVEDQLEVERILDSKNDLLPLRLPFLMKYMHPHWIDYWDKYVIKFEKFDDSFYRRPPVCWKPMSGFKKEWDSSIFVERNQISKLRRAASREV